MLSIVGVSKSVSTIRPLEWNRLKLGGSVNPVPLKGQVEREERGLVIVIVCTPQSCLSGTFVNFRNQRF